MLTPIRKPTLTRGRYAYHTTWRILAVPPLMSSGGRSLLVWVCILAMLCSQVAAHGTFADRDTNKVCAEFATAQDELMRMERVVAELKARCNKEKTVARGLPLEVCVLHIPEG